MLIVRVTMDDGSAPINSAPNMEEAIKQLDIAKGCDGVVKIEILSSATVVRKVWNKSLEADMELG